MLAVIKTGGKQYIVSPGKRVKIEKLPQIAGETVVFDSVLLIEDEGNAVIGNPTVQNAVVKGKIIKQDKAKKVIIFKFKAKKRQKKKKGHRQPYTEVEITEIQTK
ncbi:MAG: 50S ribosomal protein L21 [Candidatus Wildermuthbacteria bacterium]|nr:50S ribosomal protein L21 [Candidatus Wildermuthbacteria bacterium]